MSHDPVLFELRDHVAVITLNRPEVRNAMNRELRQALMEGLHRVREEDEIRVAIITGAGRAFSAGADLKERAQVGRAEDANAASIIEVGRAQGFARSSMEKPLIAAVDGYCLAAGFELALICDMRICTPGGALWLAGDRARVLSRRRRSTAPHPCHPTSSSDGNDPHRRSHRCRSRAAGGAGQPRRARA